MTSATPHHRKAPGDSTAPLRARTRTLVLYIEDDPTNVRLLEHILRRNPNTTLISATRGDVGLKLARHQAPDLILLDLSLPDMSGDTVAAALKRDPATRAIPIVVLTGAADESQLQRLLEHGASGYLAKPFRIADILAVVERFAGTPASRQQ